MNRHHGIQRHLDQTLKVAHPENPNMVPNTEFLFARGTLDTDSRVTPNSLFEHEMDDTSMFLTPMERVVTLRKRNGRIVEAPEYLQARLAYLRGINALQVEQMKTDDFVNQEDVFPNGAFRNALIARYLDQEDLISETVNRELQFVQRAGAAQGFTGDFRR